MKLFTKIEIYEILVNTHYSIFTIAESRLCPSVASIYDPEDVIIEKIKSFNCRKCEIPFEILKNSSPEGYKMLVE